MHRTLVFFLYTCISPLCTKFSSSSIIYCNIVVNGILQIRLRWTHESDVMLTILSNRPLTYVQYPNTLEYCENTSVLPEDIPHMEIHISPRSITNCSMNCWNAAVTHKVPTKSIEFCIFSILHQYRYYAVTITARSSTCNEYVQGSHMQGLIFSLRFSVLKLYPAPRVSWCCKLSSSASGSILYVCRL